MVEIPMMAKSSLVNVPMVISASTVTIGAKLAVDCDLTRVDVYEGEIEFTPSAEVQTISTSDKLLQSDITINPIPSNYGLITWNGSTIMVS